MTPSEEALYDALGDYIDQTYNNASPEKRSAVGFVLTIYQRRLASSFYALQRTLNKRLANMGGITDEDLSQDETIDEAMDADDAEDLARESLEDEEKSTIRDLLKAIAKVGTNTKARKLKSELDDASRRLRLGNHVHPVRGHDGLSPGTSRWGISGGSHRLLLGGRGKVRDRAGSGRSAARSRSSSV